MPGESSEFSSCGACGRTILRGERAVDYIAPDGEPVGVCSLCRPAAERAGWLRTDLVGTTGVGTPMRRRGLGLRGRLSRATETARELAARPARRRASEREAPPRSAPEPAPPAPPTEPPAPLTPERLMRRAVERFNATDQTRKVAGLIRSLGEPRVAVAADVGQRVLVTVAWELSWYRWEVRGDGSVHEVGKGSEIAELGDDEPGWNARAGSDGSLSLETAATARAGSASVG